MPDKEIIQFLNAVKNRCFHDERFGNCHGCDFSPGTCNRKEPPMYSQRQLLRWIDTAPIAEAFQHPEKLNGCYGRDRDHGTLRRWSDRISYAQVINE